MKILCAIAWLAFIAAGCAVDTGPKIAAGPLISEPVRVPKAAVHFETGRDEVGERDMADLIENANWMSLNPSATIVLEGHCDERGGDEYNLELGDRRAREVLARLIEQGAPANQVAMIVSYGEKRPADPAHTRRAWRKNRRVEFRLR